jgi:hypothetical protein
MRGEKHKFGKLEREKFVQAYPMTPIALTRLVKLIFWRE